MNNKNVTSPFSGRTKIFLLTALGICIAADLAAFIYLLATGAPTNFWIFPLLSLIFNAIFLLQAVISNFRFLYTVAEFLFYSAASLTIFFVFLGVNVRGGSVMSYEAGLVWIIGHAFGLLGVLVSFIYTSKKFKGSFQTVAAITLVAVCLVTCIYYGVYLGVKGFFGQNGAGNRPLVYEYDEQTETYAVTDVLEGNGEKIYVPEEFNGKKIRQISESVFYQDGVKEVTLDCSEDVIFSGGISATPPNMCERILVKRGNADEFKQLFYCSSVIPDAYKFTLGNRVFPYDLKSDEVCVTFEYDADSYNEVSGQILRTWYGKSGDVFRPESIDVPYALRSDRTSDIDLDWNFNYNGKKIMSSVVSGNKDIIGSAVFSSLTAKAQFENIYRIYPEQGNDAKFKSAENFEFSNVYGKLDFRYAVAGAADGAVSSFFRDNFETKICYSFTRGGNYDYAGSLSAVLYAYGGTDVFVKPEHKLIPLTVVVVSDTGSDHRVTYGEDISFSAYADIPDGFTADYNWVQTNGVPTDIPLDASDVLSLKNVSYGDKVFKVETTLSGENTSLTAVTTDEIGLKVEKRILGFYCVMPENAVYDGYDKTVFCSLNHEVINGDDTALAASEFTYKNAGRYVCPIALSGADSEKYGLSDGIVEFTIQKAPLNAVWLKTESVFNGSPQSAEVRFDGIKRDDEIKYKLNSFTEAGEWTAAVVLDEDLVSSNYELKNGTSSFIIKPYGITAQWQSDVTDGFVYDGAEHSVTVSAEGVGGESVPLRLSAYAMKNAGVYEIRAYCDDKNYEIISGGTKSYEIEKYGLTVEWGNTELIYTGRAQMPSYVMRGVGTDGNILGGGRGAEKNAGNYSCEMVSVTAQYDHEKNYYIRSGATTPYSIKPVEAEVKWEIPAMTYNGEQQSPRAWINGIGDDAGISLGCEVTGARNAGEHEATATLKHELAGNYILTGDKKNFTIDKAFIEISPDDCILTYGESLPATFTYTVTQFPAGDREEEIFGVISCGLEEEISGDPAIGSYKIVIEIERKEKAGNYEIILGEGTLTVIPAEEVQNALR